ncbi:MAG: SDR family oxidoreductase [Deltaproteobacteria bacterium]|nr:SDR family oxidoreductase [Deltaproteobacteria bacterium]
MSDKKTEDVGSFDGRVLIVTGGASGIGKATCFEMARKGTRTVVVDLSQSLVDEVVGALSCEPNTNEVMGIVADVRLEQDMEKMVFKVLERFGRIDILVHCAGILRVKDRGPRFLHQLTLKDWDTVIDTNLKGTFLCNRAVVTAMLKKKKGKIINISSTSGLKGRAFDSAYCASKFGMIGLSEALAEEVRQYGIHVHVVLPDAVDTPIWEQNAPMVRAPEDSISPERVANVITYLSGLPDDMVLSNLVIRPFRTRRRRKKINDK